MPLSLPKWLRKSKRKATPRAAGMAANATSRVRAQTPSPDARLLEEVLGVVLLAMTTLMVVSIASYRVDDPSWASSGIRQAGVSEAPTAAAPLHNLAGTVGAHLADGMFQMLGAAAYMLPILLVTLGGMALRGGGRRPAPVRVAGWMLFFIATPALLDLWLISVWTVGDGRILFGRAGGLVGQTVNHILTPYFADVGTVILLVCLFMVGVIMGPAVTFRRVAHILARAWNSGSERLAARRAGSNQRARPRSKRATPEPKPVVEAVPARRVTTPPTIVEPAAAESPAQEPLSFMRDTGNYQLPPLSLLDSPAPTAERLSREELVASSQILERKLADYGVEGRVSQVHPGPVVTMYEFAPASGVKVSKISSLADDLALAMSATRVRIVAPIPGKSVVGIEIPNRNRETVSLRELLGSPTFAQGEMHIPLALGKDIFGAPVTADLATMPHLLVAGSTGSGKSVGLNTMILSLIYAATPGDVKLAMVDPKMLELSVYDGIPHLIHPVITDPKDAVRLFRRMVSEMMRRYTLMQQAGVRSIAGYNKCVAEDGFEAKAKAWREQALEAGKTPPEHGKLPYVVLIVDELADLMAVASKELEDPIARLAQMARAAGIHLILATQRPSVDVLTGLIKANFPSRIAFQVSSRTDSRTILDANGAEQLLGRGDMLFLAPGAPSTRRIHGAFVSDAEVHKVVAAVKEQQSPDYDDTLLTGPEATEPGRPGATGNGNGERDETYDRAIALVAETGKASASFLQRRMRLGYPRAARMMELMEEDGIVGPADGSRPREVHIRPEPGAGLQ